MSNMIEIGKISEILDGSMKMVTVKDHEFLLARVGDKYYATDNRCPHFGGKLSEGELEGTIVTCPKHGSQFDISNGQVKQWLKPSGLIGKVGRVLTSPKSLGTYNVEVKDDAILIEI